MRVGGSTDDYVSTFSTAKFRAAGSTIKFGRIGLVRGALNPIGPGAPGIKSWFVDKDVEEEKTPVSF